ncbi:N-6 DNA methylase [Lysinibacillus sp. G4S2]|uniref:Eco57I restriction-modification methylase domain-containing protein n=1 Tax=Lysinibacillus sp. G4S2 TaxID=3055859 RepID=UPI0025A1193F|nr:N-6 DNA methylase [Lysinibacillus sp. G4S2]MDM5250808.1 N-6 DNA methylase [Lysinibacillus sp. G4S2]
MKDERYIEETVGFLKKINTFNLKSLENFYLLYCISFCSKYIKLNEWEKSSTEICFKQLKVESINFLNKRVFEKIDLEDPNLFEYYKWLKKNIPSYTTEDILGNIYMKLSVKEHRKKMGEHYTKNTLVEFIIDEVGTAISKESKIIDPACGSGNFLVRILSNFLREGNYNENNTLINRLASSNFLIGVDVQEIPCLITKLRFLMEIVFHQKEINPDITLPVYRLDSLLTVNEYLEDNQYDLVITNPPFLRYQLIDVEIRKQLKINYFSASGRFDLYTLFIEKSLKLARPKGKVIILCSDKFMEAQYGLGIRKFIEENAHLTTVYNLSSIFPFKAAVLSAIYFFDKSLKINGDNLTQCFTVSENLNVIKKEFLGQLIYEDKWRYGNSSREHILVKIQRNSNLLLNDMIDKISIGLQTTFDKAFIKDINKEFISNDNVEIKFIKSVLRGRDLDKWRYKWSKSYVLYPYLDENGHSVVISLDKYPKVEQYLLRYYEELSSRSYFINHPNKKWFEHWNQRSFSLFKDIKILTPEISSYNCFSLDTEGYFYNGTIYGITLKDRYDLNDYKYLLGILNSKLLNFVHRNLNSTHLQSNKYRYQASTMKKYPIVFQKNSKFYNELVSIVNDLLKFDDNQIELEKKLNDLVYKMYKVHSKDRSLIEEFCD